MFVTEGISRCWGPSVDKFHVLRDVGFKKEVNLTSMLNSISSMLTSRC